MYSALRVSASSPKENLKNFATSSSSGGDDSVVVVEGTAGSQFAKLSDSLLLLLLSFCCKAEHLSALCEVSRRFKRIASSDYLWTNIFFDLLAITYPSLNNTNNKQQKNKGKGNENQRLLSGVHKWYDPTMPHAKQKYTVLKKKLQGEKKVEVTINIQQHNYEYSLLPDIDPRRHDSRRIPSEKPLLKPIKHQVDDDTCSNRLFSIAEKFLIVFPIIFFTLVVLKGFQVKYFNEISWTYIVAPMVVFVLCVCMNIVIFTLYSVRKSAKK